MKQRPRGPQHKANKKEAKRRAKHLAKLRAKEIRSKDQAQGIKEHPPGVRFQRVSERLIFSKRRLPGSFETGKRR
jgi:hypothetical protein